MNMVLITGSNCPACEVVKNNLPNGHGIRMMDADTPEGMTEMAYHGFNMIPALIVDDETVILGMPDILDYLAGKK